jgi:pimeloyl-ACP methyl ester carboxylesterase
MLRVPYAIHEKDGFRYVDEGPRDQNPPVVLLHGMLGALDNWTDTIGALAERGYRVLVPVLPVYDMPKPKTNVMGLVNHTQEFLRAVDVSRSILVGNSLGGHVALKYALEYQFEVEALVLSGASGIYEVTIGNSTPRRYDREFIREKAALTFYDPRHATDELVDDMYEIMTSRPAVVRLIRMTRSTRSDILTDRLGEIALPTLLVWGSEDIITPPDVAREFEERLPRAELHFIPNCGHAPMIEHPEKFNEILIGYLDRLPRISGRTRAISDVA